jgi:hypothetical protein
LEEVLLLPLSLLAEALLEDDLVPQSNAVPGVLGVLLAEPNDAKAPVPSPNAPEGDAMPALFKGAFRLVCEPVSPPKRDFVAEKTRVDVSRELSLSFVASDSLLFL